jgi:hypothetical protein
MKKVVIAALVAIALVGCSDSNVAIIKVNAEKTWNAAGFEVVGYEGYEWTGFGRWGGCVWYTVKRGTTTYDGCLTKWGDEYHIYSLKALDALKGN